MPRPADALPSPLVPALRVLAGTAAIVVGLLVALVATGPLAGVPAVYAFPVLAALYGATGLAAWWRRPAHRLGPLLVVAGGAWALAGLGNTAPAALIAVGTVTASLPLTLVVHLLHACPGGRVRGRPARLTVAAAYVVGVVLQVPLWAFTPQEPPYDVVLVAARPGLATAGAQVQQLGGLAVVAATVVLLARRVREQDARQRWVLAPLYGYGLLALLSIPVGSALLLPHLPAEQVVLGQTVALAALPLGFLGTVLRGGFARSGALTDLVTTVAASSGSVSALEAAVAATLGDPTARLLRWSPEQDAYLDGDGAPVPLPAGGGRAAVRLDVGDRRLGALLHDEDAGPDPAVVAAVGRVVAVALDRDRLAHEVGASRQALREASSRVLGESDRTRRRFARDLHDGLQVSLVRLSMQAHALAEVEPDEARAEQARRLAEEVDGAAASLRALVQGLMPPPLVERGLVAAVQELAYGLPVRARLEVDGVPERLPPPVESTAYFVVAEALTNVVKHADAAEVDVRLAVDEGVLVIDVADDGRGGARTGGTGSGLPSLRDRLQVLGGTLRVDSGDGGTRLQAEVPCG